MLQTADQAEIEGYIVDRVDEAWLDDKGDLKVCLSGQTPSGQQGRFVISASAESIVAAGREAGTALGDSRIVARHAIPEDKIGDQCGPFPDGSRKILVERIASDRTTQPFLDSVGNSPTLHISSFPANIDPRFSGPVIYQLDQEKEGIGAIILYQRESPEQGTARFVGLDLQVDISKPNGMLLLILPVTLVVDAAIIYVCLVYVSGSCI
jgi:hypothetical protein